LTLEDWFYCDAEYKAQATCWRKYGLNSKKCIIWHFRWEIRGLRIDSIVMPKGKRKPRAGTDLALAGSVAGMGDLRYLGQRASLHIDLNTLFEKAQEEYIFLGNLTLQNCS